MSVAPNRSSCVILTELTALVGDLQRRPVNVDRGLRELINGASRHVPGAQYAGITLTNQSNRVTTPAATHRYAVMLDQIQQQHEDGPCLSAAWEHRTVRIDDLAADSRWPRYRQAALHQTPIRSMLSFELSVHQDGFSTLNFYAEEPGAFDEESVELGLISAMHTGLAWDMLCRDEQFRNALATRDIIGQAKGILMERFNIDAPEAFKLLAKLSQECNVKVANLAQRLVNREHPAVLRSS